MTNAAVIVMNAFLKLSEAEKKEVLSEIKKYDEKGYVEKGSMNEDFRERTKRIMGPLSTQTCPTCGR